VSEIGTVGQPLSLHKCSYLYENRCTSANAVFLACRLIAAQTFMRKHRDKARLGIKITETLVSRYYSQTRKPYKSNIEQYRENIREYRGETISKLDSGFPRAMKYRNEISQRNRRKSRVQCLSPICFPITFASALSRAR